MRRPPTTISSHLPSRANCLPAASRFRPHPGQPYLALPSKAHTQQPIDPIQMPFCGWPYGAPVSIGRRSADCACLQPKASIPIPRTLLPKTPAACYAVQFRSVSETAKRFREALNRRSAAPGPYKAPRYARACQGLAWELSHGNRSSTWDRSCSSDLIPGRTVSRRREPPPTFS